MMLAPACAKVNVIITASVLMGAALGVAIVRSWHTGGRGSRSESLRQAASLSEKT